MKPCFVPDTLCVSPAAAVAESSTSSVSPKSRFLAALGMTPVMRGGPYPCSSVFICGSPSLSDGDFFVGAEDGAQGLADFAQGGVGAPAVENARHGGLGA